MRAVDIIKKKRDGIELTEKEIVFFLTNYMKKDIPEYQISAFLMAVYFQGMTMSELQIFTREMIYSGDTIKLDGINKYIIDKHSTGGVGDKTTIALAPIFAALGLGTAKLTGKGLGHTGGTIDKFESIKGFKFSQTRDEFINIVNETGIGLMGYSKSIVPLDKELYTLRDVTATVKSIPLIASSIMSKKLAIESNGIILDIKVGSGAFMKNRDDAKNLAETMLKLGKSFDRKMRCILTDMDQPLGHAVGNSLELIEGIETLKGNGPTDFVELIETLAGNALIMKGDFQDIVFAKGKVREVLKSGEPLKYLKGFIEKSGGNPNIVDNYDIIKSSKYSKETKVNKAGYISKIDAEKIGEAAMILGAGREQKDDVIEYNVGIVLNKKVGDKVKNGDTFAKICYNKTNRIEESEQKIMEAIEISKNKTTKKEIILEILE